MKRKKTFKLIFSWSIILIILNSNYIKAQSSTPIPSNCMQIVMVLTDSADATNGLLYYFQRDKNEKIWTLIEGKILVVLGRSGLGWGIGLHKNPDVLNLPLKEEGDGRSPAGVFSLSSIFGYQPQEEMKNLKMPYIHITEMSECIDDVTSKYYNQIISREKTKDVDWQSSEKMGQAGIYYELGVVVDHNFNPREQGAGSCIFLHNWSNPNETMAGCTAMSPPKMKQIVFWLDQKMKPILVQLTDQLYSDLHNLWELPEVAGIE